MAAVETGNLGRHQREAMLQIRRPGAAAQEPDGVLRRLLACHDRIRMFTGLAGAVASASEGTEPAELVDAARRLLRYFTVDLPFHSADEDESLLPRLRWVDSAEVQAALLGMTRQHAELQAVIDDLCWAWARILEEPARRHALHVQLASGARQLADGFAAHLDVEEKIIFPQLQQLADEEQRAILREMERRRARPTPA